MPPTPSRQALRYLTSICRNPAESTTPTTAATTVIATVTSTAKAARCVHYKSLHTKVHAQTQQSRGQSIPRPRQFSTCHVRHAKPAGEFRPDPDPQNTTTTKLPDITNYYTLFPTTLPNGPPRPTPPVQSTDTIGTTTTDTGNNNDNTSTFDIHTPTLRREFLRLQATHHPDKFPASTPAHQKSLALSSLINTAYKTLSDPLLRAQYLLQLTYDVDVTSEDNAAFPTDQETLMQVMEVQEKVEEAKGQEEIDAMKEENDERIRTAVEGIGRAFGSDDVDGAVAETVRLKYWTSVKQGLDDWEEGKEVRLVH